MKIKICDYDYDELNFWKKLILCLFYPLLAVVMGLFILIILAVMAILLFPFMIVVWIAMLIKLFIPKK